MPNKLKLSALDGYVLIGDSNVSVMNDGGLVVQVSVEEWELLREQFRFDDVVDYERGETPMTVFQFQSCVEMMRKIKNLETENETLRSMI